MGTFLLILTLAGIVSMDTTAGPQLLVSEPIVSCTLAGCVFGNIETGVALGILFQMLWIGYLPLGAVHFTDNNLGSLVATSSLLGVGQYFGYTGTLLFACIIPAMLFGVLVSIVGMHARILVRRINGIRTERFIDMLDSGNAVSVARVHIGGVLTSFIKGMIMALIFIPIGIAIAGITLYLPNIMKSALAAGAHLIAGATAASAFLFYLKQKQYTHLTLGAAGGLSWVLLTIG